MARGKKIQGHQFSPYRALREEARTNGKREPKTKSLQRFQESASGSKGQRPFLLLIGAGYRQGIQIASAIATGTLLPFPFRVDDCYRHFEMHQHTMLAAIWQGALAGTHGIWGWSRTPLPPVGRGTLFSKPRQRFQWPAKLRRGLAPNRVAQRPNMTR